jgi:glycerol-3-phosphate acyltransferase PlsY
MPTARTALLILIPLAYLAGSVPFGLLVGLSRGVDPRKAGSGNIGATNVGRLLGGKFFALVFTLDMLKGLLPTLAAGALLHFSADSATDYLQWLLAALAAILGHMFSLFLGFKGGKGVATSAGVILGVFPYYTYAAVVAVVAFLIVFKLTRYVSAGSICAALAFTASYILLGLILKWDIFHRQAPLLGFALLMTALIIYKHRTNLVRLRAGTEHRFGPKAESAA